MTPRRHFLKTALGSSLLPVRPAPASESEPADVLVIGAGVAGLAAAGELIKHGKNVIVLEGRDRTGGRVWTDRSVDRIPLDLGAQWLHGFSAGNPLTPLVNERKLTTRVTDFDAQSLCDHDGKILSDEAEAAVWRQYRRVMAAVRRERRTLGRRGGQDVSLQSAIDRAAAAAALAPDQVRWLAHVVNTEVAHEYAADAADLSLLHHDDDESAPGPDVMFPEGYDPVVRVLGEGVDVRLRQVVRRVGHDSGGVTVTTDLGSFRARRAVVTLPLGVLRANRVAFDPPLPERKLAAIRRLGMGVLNKVCLVFPRVFWPADAELFGYSGPTTGEWAEWYDLARVTGRPVLMGFNAGRFGRALEAEGDGTVVAAALTVLRTLFGRDVPDPRGWRVTRWAADPFAGGSYSYLPPGATPDDRRTLAEPVSGRLFFAGEATATRWPSTVHGALQSGLREARRVVATG